MKNQVIDKWESIPNFILNNDKMLFNGIYIPKGSYLTVHNSDLISFGFRGNNNPKVLLRSPNWHLYELEFKTKSYEHVVPELNFASAKFEFHDYEEKHVSRRVLEGIVTGVSKDPVSIVEFEIYFLKESGIEEYTDYEYFDERDKQISVEYDIDVDCAIMTKFSHEKCLYITYNAGHENYSVFFGTEKLIKEKIFIKTHWFDSQKVSQQNNFRTWKKRAC